MATALPSIKTALQGTIEPIDITITDVNGRSVTPTALTLNVINLDGTILWSDDISLSGTQILNPSPGYYYYPMGVLPGQTDTIQDCIFQWTITIPGIPVYTTLQNVKVIPPQVIYNIPYLRLMIDKSRKVVDTSNDVYLGYTDAQLIMFMEGGMQIINAYQPETIAGFNVLNFPWNDYRHIANECALMAGVLSQQLFAIDTDMPNYSDQGATFVIAHQPQLASMLNQITQRLDKAIPTMKMQFVSTGSIYINQGPDFKFAMLVGASPTGSLFRNMYFHG